MRRIAPFISLAVFAAAAPATSTAQAPTPPAGCYGFAFGRWHPALDLVVAGHAADGRAAVAPDGRSWASTDDERPPADSGQLMLFPGWWPAGVRLRAARLPVPGDTVRGVAIALVADGRVTAPRSQALVWGKRCDERVQGARAGVAPRPARGDTARAAPTP
jgi:hypothetical protein